MGAIKTSKLLEPLFMIILFVFYILLWCYGATVPHTQYNFWFSMYILLFRLIITIVRAYKTYQQQLITN